MMFDRFRRPPTPKPTMTDAPPAIEVRPEHPLTKKIRCRMTTMKEESGLLKRVTVRRFKISKSTRVFRMKTGKLKDMEWGAYFNDLSCLDRNNELSWDVNYSEPLDPSDGLPNYSSSFAIMLANSFVSQAIKVATLLSGFIFQRRHILFMLVAGLFGGMLMISLDTILHITPTTVIHWVPSLPK